MVRNNVILSNLLNKYIFPSDLFKKGSTYLNIASDPVFYFKSVNERILNSMVSFHEVSEEDAVLQCKEKQITYTFTGNAPYRVLTMEFDHLLYTFSEQDQSLALKIDEELSVFSGYNEECFESVVGQMRFPSPSEIANHVEIIHRHSAKFFSLVPKEQVLWLKTAAKLYFDTALELIKTMRKRGIVDANSLYLNAVVELSISDDCEYFTLSSNSTRSVTFSKSEISRGIDEFANVLLSRIIEIEKECMNNCQYRLDVLANPVSHSFEFSNEVAKSAITTLDDYSRFIIAKFFNIPFSIHVDELGRNIKQLNGWYLFEDEDKIKQFKELTYNNFDVKFLPEEKTVNLEYHQNTIDILDLKKKILVFKKSPYPGLDNFNEFDQHLDECIKKQRYFLSLSENTQYKTVQKLVDSIINDVIPIIGTKTGYNLTLGMKNMSEFTISLAYDYESDRHNLLDETIDTSSDAINNLLDIWKIAFKRWILQEIKDAKLTLDEYKDELKWLESIKNSID